MRYNYYDLDKTLHLYKNANLFFSSNENNKKTKGRLIVSINTSPNDIYNTINSNLIIKQFIKGYFYPFKTERLASCRNKKVSGEQESRYKEIENLYPNLTFKRKYLDLYSNYNVYFDTYGYYKLFEETFKTYKTFESKLKAFIPFLKEVLGKTNVYPEVFIQVIPKSLITTGKEFSIENILYLLLKRGTLDLEFFSKYKFIFSDKNNSRMFLVDFTDPKFKIDKFKKLSNILYKLSNGIELDKEDEVELQTTDKPVNKTTVSQKTEVQNTTNKVVKQNSQSSDITKPIKQKIVNKLELTKKLSLDDKDLELLDKLEKKIDSTAKEYDSSEDLEDELNSDEKFIKYLIDLKDNQTTVLKAKIDKLKEKQNKIKISVDQQNKQLTIDNILKDHENNTIKTEPIKIETLNEEVKNCTLKDLDRNYVKNQKDKDLIKVLSAFNNDPECPIYITGLSRQDISDEMNKKELIKVKYEDGWGNTHNVNIEMPIIYDNSFMYLNDHKISIGKQLMKLPITKNKPNEVSISTDYNKMFFWRFNSKLSSNSDKLKNFILKDAPNYKSKLVVKLGKYCLVSSRIAGRAN